VIKRLGFSLGVIHRVSRPRGSRVDSCRYGGGNTWKTGDRGTVQLWIHSLRPCFDGVSSRVCGPGGIGIVAEVEVKEGGGIQSKHEALTHVVDGKLTQSEY
jgi:hypothetical protein